MTKSGDGMQHKDDEGKKKGKLHTGFETLYPTKS
jgi:hypothetical protein